METAADMADYHTFIHGWRDVGSRILFSSVLLLPHSWIPSCRNFCPIPLKTLLSTCVMPARLHVSYALGLVVPQGREVWNVGGVPPAKSGGIPCNVTLGEYVVHQQHKEVWGH